MYILIKFKEVNMCTYYCNNTSKVACFTKIWLNSMDSTIVALQLKLVRSVA